VRAAFLNPPDKGAAREQLGLDPNIPVALVVGGSQGAHTLNTAMAEAIRAFGPDEIQFIWGTGKAEAIPMRQQAEGVSARVQIHAFIEDMATACAAADLVVSRAGASTTAELAALGRASILAPYPYAADNHQEHNARAFERAGAAVVLLDAECTGARLTETLRGLIASPEQLARMGEAAKTLAHPAAADAIVETIIEIVHKDGTKVTRSDP